MADKKIPSPMGRLVEDLTCRFDRQLRRKTARHTRSAAETDDVVQETYRRLLELKCDPALIRNPLGLVNFVASQVAGQRAESAAGSPVEFDSSSAEKALDDRARLDSRNDPAEIEQQEQALRRRLARLRSAHRKVFLLKELEGHSNAEIASLLQIPEHQVKRYLFEANRKLKALRSARGNLRSLHRKPKKG